MNPLDQVDIQWIFSQCMYALARLSIEYYLDESIGSGRYSMDTQWIFTQCKYGLARLSITNVGPMNNKMLDMLEISNS